MSNDDAGEGGHEAERSPVDAEGDGRSPSRVLRGVLVSLGVMGLVPARVVGGGLWFLTHRWAGNIDRVSNVFEDLDEEARPAPATPAESAPEEPVTFLLVGSDTLGETPEGEDPAG